MERLQQLEATLKERDKLLLEYTGKSKELTVTLHLEQEAHSRLKGERESLERELRGARDELLSLRSMQTASADAVSQKVKDLAVERRTLKARVE